MKKTGKQSKTSGTLKNTLKKLKELELIISRSPAILCIWRFDRGWLPEFVSDNVSMFGYTKDDLLSGRVRWVNLVHPEDFPRIESKVIQCLQKKISKYNEEYRIITKNGDICWVEDRTTAIFNAAGKVSYFHGTVLDITYRKKSELELRKSEERFRELIYNSSDMIVVLDKDGIFRYLSPSIKRLSGYEENDLIGKSCFDLIHPDDLELAINGIIINARDITERKLIEAQLLQTKKMEAIGALAAGIAHDFNNILMGIQGYVSLLLIKIDTVHPDFEKLINIQSLVQSGADLTGKLLGFARGGQYEVKPTDINELISKTANLFGRTKKEIIIHQKYEKNICTVEVDRTQIEQVLLNLYVNAWQAMPHGGHIYMETENITINRFNPALNLKAGNYVKIKIADTGVGMDEETRQRVFEPFFSTKEKGRGIGLGLASAYGIIKEHGGIIAVSSELGQGTVFTIFLPASKKKIQKETYASKTILKGTETILLVDDEETIINVCRDILLTLGYKVFVARDGSEALNIYSVNKDKIDLVILDMIMPGLSGSETFDQLKLINPEVRVMLATGYSINNQAKKIMEKGCRVFIQKPFHIEELSQKLREVLDGKTDA